MDVAVRDIARNDAKARDMGEVVYDVIAVVNARDRAFEMVVSLERIASAMIPCVTFRDPADATVFRHDQRPIVAIFRAVTDAYNREKALLPAS